MTNTLQYLDYEGLKYYDKKLKSQLGSLIPKDGKDGFSIYVLTESQANDLVVKLNSVEGLVLDRSVLADFLVSLINGTTGYEQNDQAKIDAIKIAIATWAKDSSINGSFILDSILFGEDSSTTDYDLGSYQSLKGEAGAAGDLSDAYEEGSDIVIKDTDSNSIKNISVGLSKDFTVVKGLGQYTQGQRISKGTSLYEIVEKLLGGKLIAEIKSKPSATYNYSPTANTQYEVGTTVNASITVTPKDTGSYTEYEGTTTKTVTTTHNVSKNIPASFNGSLTATQKLQAECVIDSVTVNAKNSDDTTTSLTISQSGSTKSSQIVLTPLMKMFIYKGALSITSNGEIDRSILIVEDLVKAGSKITYTNSKGLLDNGFVYFFVPATGALTESCAADKKWRLYADTSADNGPKDKSGAPITGFEKLTSDGTANGTPVIVKIKDASETLRNYHVYRFKTDASVGLGSTEVNLQFDYVSTSTAETSGMSYFSI